MLGKNQKKVRFAVDFSQNRIKLGKTNFEMCNWFLSVGKTYK